MDRLSAIIDSVNAFAWGPPMLGILGVTGVLLTLGLVFMPWRKVGYGTVCAGQRIGAVSSYVSSPSSPYRSRPNFRCNFLGCDP